MIESKNRSNKIHLCVSIFIISTVFLSGSDMHAVEQYKLLARDARRRQEAALTWLNFGGVVAGILVMYLTAFLVKV